MNPEEKKLSPDNSPEKSGNTPGSQKAVVNRATGGRVMRTLSFLMSLTALAAVAWLVYDIEYKQQDLLRGDIPHSVRRLSANVDKLKETSASATYDINRLKEDQKTLTEAMRQASQHLGQTRVSWVMAETEQLMIVANQRLQLAGDLDTAATALEIADQRLRDLADPDLTPVRKILATEIQSLKSAERADIPGIALRLGTLSDAVSSLPLSLEFQQVGQPQPAPATGKKGAAGEQVRGSARPKTPGFFAELWADIMSVISIRTNVESYKPLLPPEQQYFLRENLRLMILGAQQAALRADNRTYTTNLKSAREWAQRYFDMRSQALAELVKELDALSSAKLVGAQPSISESLRLLRDISRKKAGL